jgi:GNAT superfamily N-acetyltransferase
MTRAEQHGASAASTVRLLSLQSFEHERGSPINAAELTQIDAIFFAASNTQQFADERERSAFHERWLGRYLDRYREHFFLALGPEGRVIGYLAGCLHDPAHQPLFSDIGYFATLSGLTKHYPAHLHINLDADWRSRGVGARLIEAFCAHAAAAGSPGVHVVTGAPSRNVGFYQRTGFHQLRSFDWNSSRLVLLARRLAT